MYKFKKTTRTQHIGLLFKILLMSTSMIFLVPMFVGVIHKYFQLMDIQMVMWVSSLSITIGVLSYLVTIFTLFDQIYWGKS